MAVTILGVEVDAITFDGAIAHIESFIHQRGPHQIVTVNPEFIMRAQTDREFREVLNHADLALPDGAGLLWASRIGQKRQPHHPRFSPKRTLTERVTGSDLVPALAAEATIKGWKLYFLGSHPGVAVRAGSVLKKLLPDLKLVGAESGPLIDTTGKPINHNQAALLEAVLGRIRHTKPDILCVAFGAPKQDRFIARYRKQLGVPVMIGVGGALDFLAGQAKRAPALFQLLMLEWLWRVILEPTRIGRIWTAVVRFPIAVIFDQFLTKKS